MTTELAMVEAEILHLAVRTAGLLCKRAVLVGDVVAVVTSTTRLNKWLAARQDFELQSAEERNACFFDVAGELDGDALALKGGMNVG